MPPPRTQLPRIGLLPTFDFASGRGDLHYGGRGFKVAPFERIKGRVLRRMDCTHMCFSPLYREPLLARLERLVRQLGGPLI